MKMFLLCSLLILFNTLTNAETTNKSYSNYSKDTESSNKLEATYANCLEDAGGINNYNVIGCSASASGEARAKINSLYRKIYKKLASKTLQDAVTFEESQKSWLVYRNKHCENVLKYIINPAFEEYCQMELNILRANELQEFDENIY